MEHVTMRGTPEQMLINSAAVECASYFFGASIKDEGSCRGMQLEHRFTPSGRLSVRLPDGSKWVRKQLPLDTDNVTHWNDGKNNRIPVAREYNGAIIILNPWLATQAENLYKAWESKQAGWYAPQWWMMNALDMLTSSSLFEDKKLYVEAFIKNTDTLFNMLNMADDPNVYRRNHSLHAFIGYVNGISDTMGISREETLRRICGDNYIPVER